MVGREAADLCFPQATDGECEALFEEGGARWQRGAPTDLRQALEKRVFCTLGHTAQREYCCRVEEIDGPPEESWAEINAYLGTKAKTLPNQRRFGSRIKVGDAFSGMGCIPFEAAELGCDVYASDLNPVACLLTWGALNLIGGTDEFRARVHTAQREVYDEVDRWLTKHGLETSEEGWRAEAYLYCIEMVVPEWDSWRVPICPSWVIAPKTKTWVELVPIEAEKRFGFRVRTGGSGYAKANEGTKQGAEVVCPAPLWEILKHNTKHTGTPRAIPYNQLIENAGGLRMWEKRDFQPRPDDILQERLYCIRWRQPDWVDERERERRGDLVYREPRTHDHAVEEMVVDLLSEVFDDWQTAGWIPNWRIEPGMETTRLQRERGWTYWHHLFTPRQLLMNGYYSWLAVWGMSPKRNNPGF
jgi:putative DNA methylase